MREQDVLAQTRTSTSKYACEEGETKGPTREAQREQSRQSREKLATGEEPKMFHSPEKAQKECGAVPDD